MFRFGGLEFKGLPERLENSLVSGFKVSGFRYHLEIPGLLLRCGALLRDV